MYSNQTLGAIRQGNSIAPEPTRPNIQNELDRLRIAVDSVLNAGAEFVDRVQPVLRDQTTSPTGDGIEADPDSGIGKQVRDLTLRLEQFAAYMRSAHDRVAL